MVTLAESIPRKSDAFLKGIDIFYIQFNDVNFYIEDEDQENFYYEILKKLFPKVKLNKIFPLRGKDNVIEKASKHIGDKKKIFLVDKDFDDLLGKIKTQSNLFYLQQYSIENYLLNENSLKEYIIEEKPKTKLKTIARDFNFNSCIQSAADLFYDLTLLHLLVQSKGLKVKNTSTAPEKYLQFGSTISIKAAGLEQYKMEIQLELEKVDKRLKVDSQLKKLKAKFKFNCGLDLFSHIPGKYLIKFFKCKVEHLFNLASRDIDSFIFRLAKTSNFDNLGFLKATVNLYIK